MGAQENGMEDFNSKLGMPNGIGKLVPALIIGAKPTTHASYRLTPVFPFVSIFTNMLTNNNNMLTVNLC